MASWDRIKAGIFAGESGGDYDALFGFSNRPGGRFSNTRLTDMTVDDAIRFSDPSGPYAQWVKGQIGRVATPMGGFQIVGTTLRGVKSGMGLSGSERMTPELQDKMGQYILAKQGTGAWEGYRGPREPKQTLSPEALDFIKNNPQPGGYGLGVPDPNTPGTGWDTGSEPSFGPMPSVPGAGDSPPGVAEWALGEDGGSGLGRIGAALAKLGAASPDAPNPPAYRGGDARQTGDTLLKLLLGNPRGVADALLGKRMG